MSRDKSRENVPLRIAHVIYKLDVGGMENGLINLINRLPAERFSHTIVCLTHATDFRKRIKRGDVEIVELHKAEGKDPAMYRRLYSQLRRIRPDIVHTRNIGTVDLAWIALAARCPIRIHSEHGWDAADPGGESRKYRLLRRLCDPAIHQYVTVSDDIRHWLLNVIGIAEEKVRRIYNGVDTGHFTRSGPKTELQSRSAGQVVFGTVGRQDAIKGLEVLVRAIRLLLDRRPELRDRLRVIMAGDGPEHARYSALVEADGIQEVVTLPGRVEDVASLLRSFEFYVQPSYNEGISNTILEAMATELPVIATAVGGNPELVSEGSEGQLFAVGDARVLSDCLERYIDDPALRVRHGKAARQRVEEHFSLASMAEAYAEFYTTMATGRSSSTVT